jgi:hypothetical protein
MRSLATAAFAALILASSVGPAQAEEVHWLDAQTPGWNTLGMEIPVAEAPDPEAVSRCDLTDPRSSDSDASQAVRERGWLGVSGQMVGDGVEIVSAMQSTGAFCTPVGAQSFVFVDGQFAGTVAPVDELGEGALAGGGLNGDRLIVRYRRYGPGDPPARAPAITSVTYVIERTEDGSVLQPLSGTVFPRTLGLMAPMRVLNTGSTIEGWGNVTPFESTLIYRIVNIFGATEIVSGPITVQGELGGPHTFTLMLGELPSQPTFAWLYIEEQDASGGDVPLQQFAQFVLIGEPAAAGPPPP